MSAGKGVSAQRRKSSFSRFSSSIRRWRLRSSAFVFLPPRKAAPVPAVGFGQNGQGDQLAVRFCQFAPAFQRPALLIDGVAGLIQSP
jgi:hypothetical protein